MRLRTVLGSVACLGILLWLAAQRRRASAPLRPPQARRPAEPAPDPDARADEALLGTFPASDPPASMASMAAGAPRR